MTRSERRETRRSDYFLVLALGLTFLLLGLGASGFWEPWESGLVQVARHAQGERFAEHLLWVPQTEHHLVYRPLALVWSLQALVGLGLESEGWLRLPGALVGLGLLFLVVHFMRRFFARRAGLAAALVLVSLPFFTLGSRLLTGGIWLIASVSLPPLLYLLASYTETARRRSVYGACFGASWVVSLLCGGLVGLGSALVVVALFVLWQRSRASLRGLFNWGTLLGVLLSAGVGGAALERYHRHAAQALARPQVSLDLEQTLDAARAGHVTAFGRYQGRLAGQLSDGSSHHAGAVFIVDLDGGLRGTFVWALWMREPERMHQALAALRASVAGEATGAQGGADGAAPGERAGLTPSERARRARAATGGRVGRDGAVAVDAPAGGDDAAPARGDLTLGDMTLPAFAPPPPPPGAASEALLEQLTHNLFDPSRLRDGARAEVRSIASVDPSLRVVFETPEDGDRFLRTLADPITDLPPPAVEEAATDGASAGDEAALTPAARAAQARALKPTSVEPGREVTILDEAAAPGWLEVQVGETQGYMRAEALERRRALEHRTFETWIRSLSYGLFPWVLVLPFMLGALLYRRLAPTSAAQDPTPTADEQALAEVVGGAMLIWLAVSVLLMGLGGSLLNQRIFTGVVPVAVAAGMWLTSEAVWRRLDDASLARKFVGFGAICLLLVLLHDLYSNPWLFVHVYLNEPTMTWEEDLRVMEGPYRVYRALAAVALAGAFMGPVGFGNRLLVRVGGFLRWRFEGLFDWLGRRRWLQRLWRGLGRWVFFGVWKLGQTLSRARLVLVMMALASAVMLAFFYLPAMSHHLTQKGLRDRYEALRYPGEPLYNLQASSVRRCERAADCPGGGRSGEALSCVSGRCARSCERTDDCGRGYTCLANQCRPEGTSYYLGTIESITEEQLLDRLDAQRTVQGVFERGLARVLSVMGAEQSAHLLHGAWLASQTPLDGASSASTDGASGAPTDDASSARAAGPSVDLARLNRLGRIARNLVTISSGSGGALSALDPAQVRPIAQRMMRTFTGLRPFTPGMLDQLRQRASRDDTVHPATRRIFAVIPRDDLARINAAFRARFPVGQRRNLRVLDDRSSHHLLVSNMLRVGEEDHNFIAPYILDERPQPSHTPSKPVRFENGLEFLGYDIEPEVASTGDKITITYYFHVTKDIKVDWQIFLHGDLPGNRINGDHYPGDGAFRTNTWIEGDYVRDIQVIELERGLSPGKYVLWFGLFSSGDNRLKVVEGDTDGGNRVRIGTLQVQ